MILPGVNSIFYTKHSKSTMLIVSPGNFTKYLQCCVVFLYFVKWRLQVGSLGCIVWDKTVLWVRGYASINCQDFIRNLVRACQEKVWLLTMGTFLKIFTFVESNISLQIHYEWGCVSMADLVLILLESTVLMSFQDYKRNRF